MTSASESITTSLKSSLLNYQYENGRKYSGFGKEKYFMPKDERENERLDLVAYMLNLTMKGELHKAPIGSNPQRILDLGTGTGIWAIDMGGRPFSNKVIGNDIAASQPTTVPPNVRFEIDDIEQDWIYSSKFDFIHMRMMSGALRNWPRLMQQVFEPGGWVEFMDFTMHVYSNTDKGTFKPGCPIDTWCNEPKNFWMT
ncbi:hypothetical protein AJ79_08466 [Helicocarpus griseus UAMH5409]|uniref:Methyltransferase domain-containing protein n=1 Tax=Helicocarpus griseus UAMH5409 TaxID=1447875 RepID=A0A2B7WSP5_9EURO|nr:hypothetical protein AJ79_08466 [Helicocarpus griseus UAMH5409]